MTTYTDEPVMDYEQRRVALGMDWGASDPADSLAYVWRAVGQAGKTDPRPRLEPAVRVTMLPARPCQWLAEFVEFRP